MTKAEQFCKCSFGEIDSQHLTSSYISKRHSKTRPPCKEAKSLNVG